MIRTIFLAGVFFSIAACQSDSEPSHVHADTSDVVGRSADVEADSGSSSPALALGPEGLHIVEVTRGSTRVLTFGTDEGEVVAAVTDLLGAPASRGVNRECAEGPLAFARWPDGLSLNFSDGRFSGWWVRGNGASRHSTMSGIGIGSKRAELEKAYDIRTGVSSLGTEFAAGGLHGVLEGTGSDAAVTSLWSGSACVFR